MEESYIKERLEDIFNRIISLHLLEEDLKYIANMEAPHFEAVVAKSHFFFRMKESILRRIVLELCMLLKQSEDLNIPSFLANLANSHKKYSWKSKIELRVIQELQSQLQGIVVSEQFGKIVILRDKFYAHADKNRNQIEFKLPHAEVWLIISKLKNIHDVLNSSFFNTTTHWSFSKVNMGHHVLESLFKYYKIRELVWEEEKTNSVNNRYSELLEIMRRY